ncbi:ATP-grasp domain-containing protein [Chenggangzhangella methanolivorans]|uniref:ATP-grasp domain-containing protein n=1 Tax=Chenggangzhangella methanolivorans TaxID=1437009 RepID=A0A9E6R825_9HYPH|nr:ATP-grasp domain-containing protein [Chenggangzhangella methanolivorans]
MTDQPPFDLAVIALSARALARSARRAGLNVLALDLFADDDTREHAAEAVRVPMRRSVVAFDRRALLDALASHAPEGLPVVFGAGFEHAPNLMRAIARRNPVLGASSETVALLKNPEAFAGLLDDLGVRRPAMAPHGAADLDAARWLSKRAGASGGSHIRTGTAVRARRYLQERVEGRAVSALFLADGAKAHVLGFSEQWPDPAPAAPFRYGGAVGPVTISDGVAASIDAALDRLVSATRLKGLASADMILPDDQSFVLLEINPRPGATLDVFDRGDMPALINLHIEACAGRLPGPLPRLETAFAAAVVHAPATTRAGAVARPHWTADWPSCDETVPAGAPFCTVFAAGQDPLAARRLLEERRDALLARLPSARVPAPTNQKW